MLYANVPDELTHSGGFARPRRHTLPGARSTFLQPRQGSNNFFRLLASSSRGRGSQELNVVLLRAAATVVGHTLGYLYRTGLLYRYGKHAAMGLVGVPALLFGGVLLAYTERMPISNRSHFVFLSHDDEQALAYEAVANILAEEGNMCLKRGDPV
ncbi:hypothetical protein H257_10048 [Aphanomyces astaci]|uniref:Uncharacterized protein n=1 Tax=Aphanomyces astaci TaxID=112090 RepID=W4G9N4_APHAT|nr:hypothetical protein H257_10048 [Aphanomyces astaci]ETV75653.1 hypothetical protein H257_10048 [Aphanomyces astaci]|eukprot:XP_009834784.1 hypothetical protein H257_10048 [Aphanomyces astaci]